LEYNRQYWNEIRLILEVTRNDVVVNVGMLIRLVLRWPAVQNEKPDFRAKLSSGRRNMEMIHL
jgi:hypothetical protein